MQKTILAIAAACLLRPPTPADTLPKPSLAVSDFQGRGVSAEEALTLSDRYTAEIMQTGRFQVLERSRISEIMKEHAFRQSWCNDAACAVEIGRLIAVRKMVIGAVSRVGGIFTVNVRMVDVETGAIETNLSEDCDCGLEEVLTGVLGRMASKMAGTAGKGEGAVVSLDKGDASLFVKSTPEGARVLVDGRIMDGVTPLTVQGLPAGRHDVRVQRGDSAASAILTLRSRRIERVRLALRRQETALKVISAPSEAEVYLNCRPGKSRWPDETTPALFEGGLDSVIHITLFKPGYFDTSFTVLTARNKETSVNVSLAAADTGYRNLQERFVIQRKHRHWGFRLCLGAGLLAAGGAAAVILALKDYDDAEAAKTTLDQSVIRSGPGYEGLLKENKDKSDSGNLKATAGVGLFGAAAACLGAGLLLYF